MQAQVHYIAEKTFASNEQSEFRIGLIASESIFVNKAIRLACKNTYADWMAINTDYLIQHGLMADMAVDLAQAINLLIEGAMTVALTFQDASLFKIAEASIPKLFAAN